MSTLSGVPIRIVVFSFMATFIHVRDSQWIERPDEERLGRDAYSFSHLYLGVWVYFRPAELKLFPFLQAVDGFSVDAFTASKLLSVLSDSIFLHREGYWPRWCVLRDP